MLSYYTLISLSICLLSFILLLHFYSFFLYKWSVSVLKEGAFFGEKGRGRTIFWSFAPRPPFSSLTPRSHGPRDSNLSSCENITVLGDFSIEPNDPKLIPLIEDYSLHSLIRKPRCCKTKNGRCIDLILTFKEHSFLLNNLFI